ncbi:capsular polysaccharide transport system permease protein [Achromobacter deleyi]|uniref:ABC transporter permease n=1 Tax=Achromobacter deleyi TaxID=1353891 RepID=UPI002856E160|nr:ABC transporter permease [Achromobacter deleyi]MDR6599654.1 capsular polysaccharide transport system permease protein [Achromobacter deleyi]
MHTRSPLQISRSVVFALILREMRSRFGRIRLGAVWTILEPLSHMIALGIIMKLRATPTGSYEFLVFLLMGLAPFLLFKNIVLKLMGSVDANKALFSYKQIQPADAFFARTIVEFCISAITFLLIYAGLTWYGYSTAIADPILWVAVLFLGIAFSFALGILFAIIAEAVPELKVILGLLFLPLYLLSGVIFPISRMPHSIVEYLLWNPYLHVLDLIRGATFAHYRIYPGVSLEYVAKCAIVISFIAYAAYRVRKFRLMSL